MVTMPQHTFTHKVFAKATTLQRSIFTIIGGFQKDRLLVYLCFEKVGVQHCKVTESLRDYVMKNFYLKSLPTSSVSEGKQSGETELRPDAGSTPALPTKHNTSTP